MIKEMWYQGLFSYHANGPGFQKIADIQDDNSITILSFYADWLKRPIRYSGKDNGRKAIVLYGEPGNGKGTITKALADESNTPIISINSADLTSDGFREKLAVAEIHASKSKNKAMIVLFDEIDLSTGDYQSDKTANGQAMQQLLTTLDVVQDHNPHTRILYIFATNHIQKLDPRMLRPGRIQHKLYVGPPNLQQRIALFNQLLPEGMISQDAIHSLGQSTDKFSRVAIESIVTAAFDKAIFESRTTWTQEDINKEIDEIKHAKLHKSDQIA